MAEDRIERLVSAISDLGTYDEVKSATRGALESGIPAIDVMRKGMSRAMQIAGQRFEEKEYFIADMIMASNLMKAGMQILEPRLHAGKAEFTGTFLIGTVRGDLHDIGKNIVAAMLRSAGFQVVDLGVDVAVETFTERVRSLKPNILGMAALLTSTMTGFKAVIDALNREGLREGLGIMVGGRPVSEEFARQAGADAYAADALDAVRKAEAMISAQKKQ